MAGVEEKVGGPASEDGSAKEVLVEGSKVVDPLDPDYITSKQLKENADEGGEKSGPDLKSTLIISGAALAVIGAILAIAKKIKKEAA